MMYIKQDKVCEISFERRMNRQNAQAVCLTWKAESSFLSYKVLIVQMSVPWQTELPVSILKPPAQLRSSIEQQV